MYPVCGGLHNRCLILAGTRPSKPCGALRVHKDIFAGETVPEKLDSLRDIMAGRKRPDGGPAKSTAETADALLVRACDGNNT